MLDFEQDVWSSPWEEDEYVFSYMSISKIFLGDFFLSIRMKKRICSHVRRQTVGNIVLVRLPCI